MTSTNPIYTIIQSFNGRRGDFKRFKFEQDKQTDQQSLILAGWDKRTIKTLVETEVLKEEPRNENREFIDKQVIKEILIKPPENKAEEKLQKRMEKHFQESFSYLEAAKGFINLNPIHYDESKMWWVWDQDEFCWKIKDKVDIMNAYVRSTGTITITKSKVHTEVLTALQMQGRINKPKVPKTKYIQFKDRVVDITDGSMYPINNKFLFTNPIPFEIGGSDKTPTMDKLFEEWVGKEYVHTLYEIIAYCCYRGYPIQVLFCFVGGGRNGKSQFQKLINKFFGERNVCSVELDDLAGHNKSRFAAFTMYKKLICQMGETNFGTITNTGMLKKLTGGDLINFEKKRCDPFDDYNYAKILINSNSMPTSTDTSDGFYRRWVIIDFPNQFPEGSDIIETIPEVEYNNLARKIIKILPKLLENGKFKNQGTIEERKNKYIEVSNPLPLFIKKYCDIDPSESVRDTELYSAYCFYLSQMKRRVVSRKEFYDFLSAEGYERRKTSKESDKVDSQGHKIREYGNFFEGIGLIYDWKEKVQKVSKVLTFPVKPIRLEVNPRTKHFSHFSHESKEVIYQKCFRCDLTPCSGYDKNGKPICELCMKTIKEEQNVEQHSSKKE